MRWPPSWPVPPAPAIAELCPSLHPLIVAIPPERWMAPPAAPLGPRRLVAGLLLWFPLPAMAWLWSKVLPEIISEHAPLNPNSPQGL